MAPERVRDRVTTGTFTASRLPSSALLSPLVLSALVLSALVLSALVLASVFGGPCALKFPVDARRPCGRGGGERKDLSDMRNCVREADAGFDAGSLTPSARTARESYGARRVGL